MEDNSKDPTARVSDRAISRRILLTVCIPSYNRGQRVCALVSFLIAHLLSRHQDDVELIVVNNCSQDDTEELLRPFERLGVRVVNRSLHLSTAEENLFHSLEFCRGEYIWFLGDDDQPVPEVFEILMDHLRREVADLFLFNSAIVDEYGALVVPYLFKMNASSLVLKGDDVVAGLGFTFALAGISSVVIKRSLANKTEALRILQIAEIYAHVAWLLRCYSQHRVMVVNSPLVRYRVDVSEKTAHHFSKLAKSKSTGNFYFWGFGLIKLLNFLVDEGVLSADGIARIIERRRDGSRFRLLDEVVHKMYEQILLAIASAESRNQVSQKEFSSARRFLEKVDLSYFECLDTIGKMMHIANSSGHRWQKLLRAHTYVRGFQESFGRLVSSNIWLSLFRGACYGYEIYRCPAGLVALACEVPAAEFFQEREKVLSFIDPVEVYPWVIVDTSYSGLIARLEMAAEKLVKCTQQQRLSQPEVPGRILPQNSASQDTLLSGQVEIFRQVTFPFRLPWKLVFGPTRYLYFRARRLASMIRRVR